MSVRAVVVAAGGANYGSLREACRRIGVETDVTDDPQRIGAATHVILPGVGAAAHAMARLRERNLDAVLKKLTQPLLGVCLGMQLLFECSDEVDTRATHTSAALPASPSGDPRGDKSVDEGATCTTCLGRLEGRVRRLPAAPSWPHMGWNTLAPRVGEPHPLLDGINGDDWFYFVHGYAAPTGKDTVATTGHGDLFSAVVARGNVHGVQFHPEKSAGAGRRVLANFFALA